MCQWFLQDLNQDTDFCFLSCSRMKQTFTLMRKSTGKICVTGQIMILSLWKDKIVGPYFFDGTITCTGVTYLTTMLRNCT